MHTKTRSREGLRAVQNPLGALNSLSLTRSARIAKLQSMLPSNLMLNPARALCLLGSFACSLAFLLHGPSASAGSLVLAKDGISAYKIVLPRQPIPSERYAAEELQKYLEKLSGAKLPIVSDDQPFAKKEILLGDNAHLEQVGCRPNTMDVGTDGFVLRTAGKTLILFGGRPRGTLNGVYTLLEEKLGVRWFTPELEVVNRTNQVILPSLDELKVPALENREVFWTEFMRDADFAARHRLNGNHYKLTEKHGGRFAVYYPFVHSFDMLVPPDLFKDHPEYFPWIGGKRVSGYVQRCLSNPEVIKMSIARVRQWIKEHPEANIFSVSQNDTLNWCQCETCKALDEREGSPAASLVQFVNTIAEAIEHDYPNVRIDTLAYQYTRRPPKTLRPRHNVIVRLCSIECCFAHSLAGCSSADNKRFQQDIIAWQPVAPLLYVWDYTPNFAHYQQPFPNFDALQPNVQFFVKHGVKGLFEQGNYSPGGNGELGPLRSYVLAKLLWNPDTDPRGHMREFCSAYYGPAADYIIAYVEALQSTIRNKDVHARIFDSPKAPYLNDNFLRNADLLLEQAEKAASGDDAFALRVRVARLPVWYVKLVTNRVEGEPRAAVLRTFLETARKAGISNISEGQSLDDWAKKMK